MKLEDKLNIFGAAPDLKDFLKSHGLLKAYAINATEKGHTQYVLDNPEAFDMAFNWASTNEGHEFWSVIDGIWKMRVDYPDEYDIIFEEKEEDEETDERD